jgi:hypothetical protein
MAGCIPLGETPEIYSVKPMTGFYRDGCCTLPTVCGSIRFMRQMSLIPKAAQRAISHTMRVAILGLLLLRSKECPSLDELRKPRISGFPHRQEFLISFNRSLLITQSLRRACQPKDGLWPTRRTRQRSLEIGHGFRGTVEFEQKIATELVRAPSEVQPAICLFRPTPFRADLT